MDTNQHEFSVNEQVFDRTIGKFFVWKRQLTTETSAKLEWERFV